VTISFNNNEESDSFANEDKNHNRVIRNATYHIGVRQLRSSAGEEAAVSFTDFFIVKLNVEGDNIISRSAKTMRLNNVNVNVLYVITGLQLR
jgi:hypothetical protein